MIVLDTTIPYLFPISNRLSLPNQYILIEEWRIDEKLKPLLYAPLKLIHLGTRSEYRGMYFLFLLPLNISFVFATSFGNQTLSLNFYPITDECLC